MVRVQRVGGGETRMSSDSITKALYACVHAAEFPAQALLRLRQDLQTEPVAVLEGRAPQEFVCAMNRHALRRGAALGMTRLDAEAISGLRPLGRSVERGAAARGGVLGGNTRA